MTAHTDLSVIIVSFNTKELLRTCIDSLRLTVKGIPYEIIVVDNASSDDSVEMLKRDFEDIVLLSNVENRGFAVAVNQALRLAEGEFILLLNTDTVVEDGSVARLVEFISTHPRAAAVGPKILSPSGRPEYQNRFFPSVAYSLLVCSGMNALLSERTKQKLFPRFFWDEGETRNVDFVEGSCFMMSREAVKKTGLLPEEYFLYFEEEEWCCRAKRLGYSVWYVPSAQVTHLGAASPLGGKIELFRRSKTLYYRRNVGRAKGLLISLIMICAAAANLTRLLLTAPRSPERRTVAEELRGHIVLLRGMLT